MNENQSYLKFSLFDSSFFIVLSIICEYIQLQNGEKLRNFLLHCIFFTIYIILIFLFDQNITKEKSKCQNLGIFDFNLSFPKLFHFLMIAYLFLETGSYLFANHDIDFQVLSSMSISYMLQQHTDFFIYFILLFILVILLISIRTNYFSIEFEAYRIFIFMFLLYLEILIFFVALLIALKSLYPFSDIKFINHYFLSLYASFPAVSKLRDNYDDLFQKGPIRNNDATLFNSNNERTLKKGIDTNFNFKDYLNNTYHPKRNLIIIQMESLEKQSVGLFNNLHPTMMPFLSNFTQQGTFIDHAVTQPFSLWTSGAIFASYCGLPHVISDQVWDVMSGTSISKWPQLPCLSKHFQNVGYNLYFSAGGRMQMMGILDFFKQAGFQVEDASTTKFDHDYDFYNYMIQKLFKVKNIENPKFDFLLKDFQLKEPFLYILNNEDTHPFFYVDQRCHPDPHWPKIEKCLNCLDQMLKSFFNAFEKSELFDHTDVFLFGDHPSVGKLGHFYQDPRDLLMFFPYLPKRTIHKQVSLYDIAPTLLDMMGIEYFPPFPFGANMLNEQSVGTFPKNDEFNYIYNKILEKTNKDLNCFKQGNCDNKWEYYKTRQFRM